MNQDYHHNPLAETQCCEKTFPQFNIISEVETCLSCGQKTKMNIEFKCQYCHHKSSDLFELDLDYDSMN